MTKTHAEFLEELLNWALDGKSEASDGLDDSRDNLIEDTYNEARKEVFDELIEKIEQFQAEQQKVTNENI